MKVLIVSTSERVGGAAVAASRLYVALRNKGIDVKMLVRDKQSNDINVFSLPNQKIQKIKFLFERFLIFVMNKFSRKGLFDIDIASCGVDITKLSIFKEADVIHLHWVNQGMLSLSDLRKICESGKKIVWTMHDLWPLTAICHYTKECDKYITKCEKCILCNNKVVDISSIVFDRKKAIYASDNITFVACSKWLRDLGRKSKLIQGNKIVSIPNTIDLTVFNKREKIAIRKKLGLPLEKKIVLFGALNVTDERKGFKYLAEASLILKNKYLVSDLVVITLGNKTEEVKNLIHQPIISLDYIKDESSISELYNAVDLFVIPSLEENLPNMIMEALACGVPCVGFNVGGIPEMISHKENGYVVEYKNSDDLAKGIYWSLYESNNDVLSNNCLNKVLGEYSEDIVVNRYLDVYLQ